MGQPQCLPTASRPLLILFFRAPLRSVTTSDHWVLPAGLDRSPKHAPLGSLLHQVYRAELHGLALEEHAVITGWQQKQTRTRPCFQENHQHRAAVTYLLSHSPCQFVIRPSNSTVNCTEPPSCLLQCTKRCEFRSRLEKTQDAQRCGLSTPNCSMVIFSSHENEEKL